MRVVRLLAVLIGMLALTTACATRDQVVHVFDDSSAVSTPFDRLLVVGVHPNANTRREFEAAVVRALRNNGISARYSLEFMRSSQPISRETLITVADEADADAVLITRLVDLKTRTEIEGGRSTFEAQRRNSIPLADFFRYEYAEYSDPLVATAVATVVLETDVYRVSDEQHLWKVRSKAIDRTSVFEAVTSEAAALARALESDGLIP